MKNIVSSLKKSVNNINNFNELVHLLIPKTLLMKCGFSKKRGLSSSKILAELLLLVFENKSMYQKAKKDKAMNGNFMTYYRFLGSSRYYWESLLYQVAERVVIMFTKLTSHNRQVLAVDDTLSERPNGKMVEICSVVFDHVFHAYKKGFRFLTIGWADGYSFIPLMFRLIGSKKSKFDADKYDKRTIAYWRRCNSIKPMSDSALEMLEKLKALGTQYVTCDSWFSTPIAIQKMVDMGYDVISVVKSNYLYSYNHGLYKACDLLQYLDQSVQWCDLHRAENITPKIQVIGAIKVFLKNTNIPVRLLFCKMKDSKNPNDITVMICTDLSLSSGDILELYAKRWAIETFFKDCKQYLGFCDKTSSVNYDFQVAMKTICLLRYILVTFSQRLLEDPKTFSEMFYLYCDSVKDLCVLNAVWEILFGFVSEIQQSVVSSAEGFLGLFRNYIKSVFSADWFLPEY